MQATNMQFTLDEDQWEQDWASVLSLASQPGASLEQMHVFALAHIIRRPIIIYGVKFVRSFRGETLGLARFQGRVWTDYQTFASTVWTVMRSD
jgi:ubiquitin thioesterase ZRANB1